MRLQGSCRQAVPSVECRVLISEFLIRNMKTPRDTPPPRRLRHRIVTKDRKVLLAALRVWEGKNRDRV